MSGLQFSATGPLRALVSLVKLFLPCPELRTNVCLLCLYLWFCIWLSEGDLRESTQV